MADETKNTSDEVLSLMALQSDVEKQEREIELAHPELFAQIKAINEAKAKVDDMWDALKQKLILDEDFDVHEVTRDGLTCRFSVSKTVKVVATDIDEVPEDLVEERKVVNEKKLKNYYELYGEVPSGCEDRSFYRLNKKITEEK